MLDNIHYDQRYLSLLKVYHCKSFKQAADGLALTPSAVAQQVRSVERELNTSLFQREGKTLLPTRECALVVEYIGKIQSMCRKMSDEVKLCKRGSEHLSVGVTPSAEGFALTGMLDRMSAFSGQLTILSGSAQKLYDMVRDYSLDLAVIEGNCDGGELNELILDTDYLSVITPPGSPYAKEGMIDPIKLLHEPLIIKPKDSGTRQLLEAKLKSAGIPPERLNILMEVESTATILKLVAGGYGLSVLSHKACKRETEQGRISEISLHGIGMSRVIRIVYRQDHDLDDILNEMQACYDQSARQSDRTDI